MQRTQSPAIAPVRTITRRQLKAVIFKTSLLLLIIPGACAFMLPFLWMVSTSLKDPKYIFIFPPQLIPNPILWDNYYKALTKLPFHVYAWNTIQITGLSMLGQLLTASLVAFGFARLRFPGRDALFVVLLSTIMLPPQVTLIPQFLIFKFLGWVDTYKALIVPSWFGGGAFSIFLLRQFIATTPLELDDAAKIDGCSYFGIYWRITLPLIKPALATIAIFGFMWNWNDFYYPVIYLNSRDNWTLTLALNYLRRANSTFAYAEMEKLMAASLAVMVPCLLVFFFAQKYFIQGIVFSGVKG